MLEKELFEYKDYGHVHIKLDQLMTEKQMNKKLNDVSFRKKLH